MRHAFEPDHLAAVSTMVAEQKSAKASVSYATAWGVGHALVLTVMATALLGLRKQLPESVSNLFEVGVGVMLIVLGVRALRQARAQGRSPERAVAHTHGGTTHAHGGVSKHLHVARFTLAKRPLFVGIVHGLAGSGALVAVAVPQTTSMLHGVLFVALYGVGAAIGMAALAGVLGAPLARIAKSPKGTAALLGLSGAVSLCVGLTWGAFALVRTFG